MIDVVVGQIPVTWSVEQNVERALEAISQSAPGSLLVLPEAALSGYDDELSGFNGLDRARLAWAQDEVARAAAAGDVHVACGSLVQDGGSWWNAATCFAPDGGRWVYRKVNLAMHERSRLAAGSALPLWNVRGVPIGVQLCREIRFPEQWHSLARQGAALLLYLTYAANPAQPAQVWRAHLISRAAETQRFVISANVADPRQHCPSMVISPRGEVLCEATGPEPQLLRVTVDPEKVSGHYLSQQRSDVVEIADRFSMADQVPHSIP